MNDQDITRHDYGVKVETDCEKFIEGLIELFDDLSDFALSRIHKRIFDATPNDRAEKLPQKDINHFKLTWYVALAELMFFSMENQPRSAEIKSMFYKEMEATATERNAMPFLMEVEDAAKQMIKGLAGESFEITFPRRFTWLLKILQKLPYSIYLSLTKRLLKND